MVEAHKGGNAGGFGGGFGIEAIGGHDGSVVGLVGAAQFHGHAQFVVEIGKAAAGVQCSRIEYALGGGFDLGLLPLCWRGPREVVVNDVFGIAIIAFEPSANGTHPSHVDIGSEHSEMVESGGGDNVTRIRSERVRR